MFYNKQNSDVLTSRIGLKHSSNNVVNDNMSFKSMYVFVKSVKIFFLTLIQTLSFLLCIDNRGSWSE